MWMPFTPLFVKQAAEIQLKVVSGICGCAGSTHWLVVSSWVSLLCLYSANALMKLDKWIRGSETPSASSKEKQQPAKRLTFVYWGRGCVNTLTLPKGQDSDKLQRWPPLPVLQFTSKINGLLHCAWTVGSPDKGQYIVWGRQGKIKPLIT